MRNSKQVKDVIYAILSIVFLSTIIVACSDKDNDMIYPASNLSVTHASFNTEAFDLFVNEDKASNEEIKYTNNTGYLNIYSGENSFTLRKAGESDTLKTEKLNLEIGKSYSLFVVNSDNGEVGVEYILNKDDITIPEAGKAKIRFANLSMGTNELTLSIKESNSKLFENIDYKETSTFKSISAKSYSFEVKNNVGDVLSILENVKIEDGRLYTLWTKGKLGGEGKAEFGIQAFVNK